MTVVSKRLREGLRKVSRDNDQIVTDWKIVLASISHSFVYSEIAAEIPSVPRAVRRVYL